MEKRTVAKGRLEEGRRIRTFVVAQQKKRDSNEREKVIERERERNWEKKEKKKEKRGLEKKR